MVAEVLHIPATKKRRARRALTYEGKACKCGGTLRYERNGCCVGCQTADSARRYAADPVGWRISAMVRHARLRAARLGVPFAITAEDIHTPATCPILGIPLERGGSKLKASSPSLDRKVPALGYVPGNIAVISARANRLKQEATVAELEAILAYLKAG